MIKCVYYLVCSGKVLIIVNYADACGFTYENVCTLSEFSQKYRKYGLEILVFPSNDFSQVMTVYESHISLIIINCCFHQLSLNYQLIVGT